MFESMDGDEAMLFRVRVAKMTDGERLPLVVDNSGLPLPTPNQWALLIRRPQVQQNTLIEELRTIAHCYDWAARRNVDLDERMDSGNGLSTAELTALYQIFATCGPLVGRLPGAP